MTRCWMLTFNKYCVNAILVVAIFWQFIVVGTPVLFELFELYHTQLWVILMIGVAIPHAALQIFRTFVMDPPSVTLINKGFFG